MPLAPRVLVTGASRGIGRAIALRLGQAGCRVAVHYATHGAAAEETRDLLGSASAGVYQSDLSASGAARALWSEARADGPVDALVNNAGVYRPLVFLEGDENELGANYAAHFDLNFRAPVELTHAAVRDFCDQGHGAVLNVASRVGFRGEAGAVLYAASKAALIAFTRGLAVELAPLGIGVFGIAPGWVETAMAREGIEMRLPEILSGIPLGRMASPEDCAHVAEFLLRPESAYLSGLTIDVNGASYFH